MLSWRGRVPIEMHGEHIWLRCASEVTDAQHNKSLELSP
jgi:hypothetical protein